MSAFDEARFPFSVSLRASGGPERQTRVVALSSGHEERNTPWSDSRRRYDAGIGIRDIDDIYAVLDFFEARRGQLYAFRYRDWSDYQSCAPKQQLSPTDQAIGTGDGTTAAFQLIKTYGAPLRPWVREIKKPVAGTVRAALDGAETAAFTVDTTTGVVTFNAAPVDGAAITAGFKFDVPVRFDTDYLEINLAAFNAGEIPSIPLVEVRL